MNTKSKAVKYIVGAVLDTPKGKVKILSVKAGRRLPDGTRKHPRAVIECLDTGTILDVQTMNIPKGKFADYRMPTVYGVGYIGSPIVIPPRESGSIVRRLYDLWANMLKRAYGNYKRSYKGVSVDKRWHNFTTFINTIHEVPCYRLWEQDSATYCLDKDFRVQGNTVYSRDTCTFLPKSFNCQEGSLRRWHGSSDTM